MRNRATTPLKVKPFGTDNIKIRQSWSKYNLYNLSRLTNLSYKNKNLFQLKWRSKSTARSYHGEQIREKQWVRMFDRRIRSVIPMDAEYLASNDGTAESAGRGSGVETKRAKPKALPVPYMQMTFAPTERRLDTAIFRALFASSARQARQFVVHGAVKVNGKQMRHPGYLLNPGDMFQVLPDRVLFATGAPKSSKRIADQPGEADPAAEEAAAAEDVGVDEAAEEVGLDKDPREVLKALQAQAKSILTATKQDLGAKRKQELRAFAKNVKRLLSRSGSATIHTDSLEVQFQELQQQLKIRRQDRDAGTSSPSSESDQAQPGAEESDRAVGSVADSEEGTSLTDTEYNELYAALQEMQKNTVDASKPYATPWRPRDYMSAFAFIPRYLEVNPKVCAAVYVRHPVARPGLAEVPTPYSISTSSTAFAWYLRRR